MPHFRKLLLGSLAAMLSLTFVGSKGALAAPRAAGVPGNFNTAFRVQNLGGSPADCSYDLYNDGGTKVFSQPLPQVAVNDSAFVYAPSVTGFPTGTFAGVVSCSQPVAAVVNFSDPSTSAGKGDAYVGTSNPANTLYVPSAYNNFFGYFTSVRIQNASSSAQTVKIEYFAPRATSATATTNVNLPANGAATVDQSAVSALRPNISYSAKLSGTAPLAATVSIFGSGTVANQLYAFSAFSGGATTIYAPVIMRNFFGYNTATTIQNIGGSAATVQLTYSNGKVKNYIIPANSSEVVADFQEATLQRDILYSSKIVSTNGQPLIVTVNESTPTTNRATTYEGLPSTSGGTTLVQPIAMKRYFGFNSSTTCQNVGNGAANISVSYVGTNSSGGKVSVPTKTVATNVGAGKSALIYQPGEAALPNGFIGSATITSTQPIVCVVNQDQNEGAAASQPLDQLAAYDAVLKQP